MQLIENVNLNSSSEKNEDKELVIKILDGHGGTGVFLSNGKKFEAVLQAIFAIDVVVSIEREPCLEERHGEGLAFQAVDDWRSDGLATVADA